MEPSPPDEPDRLERRMIVNLPTDNDLDAELETRSAHELSAEQMLKDTVWDFKFTQTMNVDPADVHCS
jgi:hypothetical protein